MQIDQGCGTPAEPQCFTYPKSSCRNRSHHQVPSRSQEGSKTERIQDNVLCEGTEALLRYRYEQW
jgi:hypothetical protein